MDEGVVDLWCDFGENLRDVKSLNFPLEWENPLHYFVEQPINYLEVFKRDFGNKNIVIFEENSGEISTQFRGFIKSKGSPNFYYYQDGIEIYSQKRYEYMNLETGNIGMHISECFTKDNFYLLKQYEHVDNSSKFYLSSILRGASFSFGNSDLFLNMIQNKSERVDFSIFKNNSQKEIYFHCDVSEGLYNKEILEFIESNFNVLRDPEIVFSLFRNFPIEENSILHSNKSSMDRYYHKDLNLLDAFDFSFPEYSGLVKKIT